MGVVGIENFLGISDGRCRGGDGGDYLLIAEILAEEEGVYTVSAEVFGEGIDMRLRSQGNMIKMID